MVSEKCMECKYCPDNWRDFSQLPTCVHPTTLASGVFDHDKGIWALYPLQAKYFKNCCGPRRQHFEPKS